MDVGAAMSSLSAENEVQSAKIDALDAKVNSLTEKVDTLTKLIKEVNNGLASGSWVPDFSEFSD